MHPLYFLKSQRHLGTTPRTTALENSLLITKILQSRTNSTLISPPSICIALSHLLFRLIIAEP